MQTAVYCLFSGNLGCQKPKFFLWAPWWWLGTSLCGGEQIRRSYCNHHWRLTVFCCRTYIDQLKTLAQGRGTNSCWRISSFLWPLRWDRHALHWEMYSLSSTVIHGQKMVSLARLTHPSMSMWDECVFSISSFFRALGTTTCWHLKISSSRTVNFSPMSK